MGADGNNGIQLTSSVARALSPVLRRQKEDSQSRKHPHALVPPADGSKLPQCHAPCLLQPEAMARTPNDRSECSSDSGSREAQAPLEAEIESVPLESAPLEKPKPMASEACFVAFAVTRVYLPRKSRAASPAPRKDKEVRSCQ